MNTGIELYQLVAPLAGLGIWERNLDTDEVFWNSIVREIFEVEESFQPDTNETYSFYQDPEMVRHYRDLAIATGVAQSAIAEIRTAKCKPRWIDLKMCIRKNADGITFIYGTMTDVTEAVQVRQMLEERELRFSLAFQHGPIGMALVGLKGEFLKVNAGLCNLLGYTEQEFAGRSFQEYTHPEDLDADLHQMQKLIGGMIPSYSMEKRYIHCSGHILWAQLNVALVSNEQGKPLYFVSQIKDVTEQKKSGEVIRAQNHRLLNFAHIVSHNLRSHAGNIHMLSNMLADEKEGIDKEMLLGMLVENTDNLLGTLTELNDVVKVHDNGLAHRELIPLFPYVQRVMTILSPSIIAAQAEMNVDIPEDLKVLFNPSYLESLFVNLITNSIKYKHPERPVRIDICAFATLEHLNIRLSDNGRGLDLELHGHKLFGMYKTFHGNEDARGMGLFLVRNQVEAMGGTIQVESQPDVGMTFHITIKRI